MINTGFTHLLFIEPKSAAAPPIIDDYTRRVTAAWRARVDGRARYRGVHFCTGVGCSAVSGNGEHTLASHFEANSLAIHYIACHRVDVPPSEIEKILTLPASDAEPTLGELAGSWQECDSR